MKQKAAVTRQARVVQYRNIYWDKGEPVFGPPNPTEADARIRVNEARGHLGILKITVSTELA